MSKPMPQPVEKTARVIQYELEFTIEAQVNHVWEALTAQLNDWWLPDFHALGVESTITLDAKAGGSMIEHSGTSSLLWYTVQHVAPEKSISLAGYCTPRWGGPCTTIITFDLEPRGSSTVVKFTDALYGLVSDKQVESLSSGWTQLLTNGLKSFLES